MVVVQSEIQSKRISILETVIAGYNANTRNWPENNISRFRNAAAWKMHIACELCPHATSGWKSRVCQQRRQPFFVQRTTLPLKLNVKRTTCVYILLHENVPSLSSPHLAPSALSHAFVSIVLRHRKSPRNLFRIRHGEADRFTLPFDRYDWILRFSTSLILASNHNRNQKASQLQQNTSQLFVTKIYNKRKILRVNFQSSN